MKVAYLTAGAGGMLCGSCMRDNTVAAAMIRQGRDVLLVPVFTPIRTDETDVSQPRVLYGGINVYLQQKFPIFRRTPRFIRKLLDSPSLLRGVMKWAGDTSGDDAGALAASVLEGEKGPLSAELDELIADVGSYQPDVVHLPDALFVGLAAEIKKRLGVAVVCTLTGEDIFLDKLPQRRRLRVLELIRERQRDVDMFISVTRYYGEYARREFGIDAARMEHVPLGVQVEADGQRQEPEVFTIGYLARICHEKGLHVLIDAFERLRRGGRDCRLKIAGYLGRADRSYLEELRTRWTKAGLAEFIDYRGEVDRAGKLELLRSISVLSVPTTYREAKGLYVLEALSQGVPVVQPGHGSFPELIEATGGGLLFEPLNANALAEKMALLMDDPILRARCGADGREAARTRYTDQIMAQRVWQVFEAAANSVRTRDDRQKHGSRTDEKPIDAANA
jgi:glycosyltransferase involved in cell wall biosynthesis